MLTTSELDGLLGLIGQSTPPYGAISETVPRATLQGSFSFASGQLFLTLISLAAATTITSITFVSVGAESGGSHLWYALYDQNLNLLGQTADQTGAAAFPASTVLTLPLTSSVVTAYGGFYYVGICCVATTRPTIACSTSGTAFVYGLSPILTGGSSTGLTSTAPNPAVAITAGSASQQFYAYVS
jgi:hypothetical protein